MIKPQIFSKCFNIKFYWKYAKGIIGNYKFEDKKKRSVRASN